MAPGAEAPAPEARASRVLHFHKKTKHSSKGLRAAAGLPSAARPLEALKQANGSAISFGSIRFLGTKQKPTKFHRLGANSAPNSVMRLLLDTTKMTPPSSLISVIGSGYPPTEVELVLRRGLSEAIRRTNAWLVTSGLTDGVSEQAAAAMAMAIKSGAGTSTHCRVES